MAGVKLRSKFYCLWYAWFSSTVYLLIYFTAPLQLQPHGALQICLLLLLILLHI